MKEIPQIANRLIVCPFNNSITHEQLDQYLINSKKGDYAVNGLISIELYSVFNKPNYKINPYIYDIGTRHPNFNSIQSSNLKGNCAFFEHQSLNSAYLFRKGLEDLKETFAPSAFDILQVQTQLSKKLNPDYLEGAAGILEFDPITRDKLYFSYLRVNFDDFEQWNIVNLVIDDPIFGSFFADKL